MSNTIRPDTYGSIAGAESVVYRDVAKAERTFLDQPVSPVEDALNQARVEQDRTFDLLHKLRDRLAGALDQSQDSPVNPMADRGPVKSALHAQLLTLAYTSENQNTLLGDILARLSL